MSLPEHLRERYEEDFQDSIGTELITVTDRAAKQPTKAAEQAQGDEIEPPDDYWDTPADPFRDPFASLAKE